MNNILSLLFTFLLFFAICHKNAFLTQSNAEQSFEIEMLAYTSLPDWQVTNMKTKYYLTTSALTLAQEKK